MLIRLVLSLGVVLALMVGAAKLLQRGTGMRPVRGTGAQVRVLARQGMGKRASVAVLAVGGRALVVGIGDDGVQLLSDLDLDEVMAPEPEVADSAPEAAPAIGGALGLLVRARTTGTRVDRPSARDQALQTVRDWTVRRPRS